jgi:hypothetical protein
MAIYGLNFNGTRIPDTAPRFAQRMKLRANGTSYSVGFDKACDFVLQGVCNTDAEADAMITQADNGHRKIHLIKRQGWTAIYTG